MDKREFLKTAGLLGLTSLLPFGKAFTKSTGTTTGGCVLIPSETAGPFPLDLTTNGFYFRQDVRENKTGVQLNLKLRIIGEDNCLPMPNLRVNIWHCDKDGRYSGYDQPGNPGQAGLTYLRGYQITDANGELEFITILPGWYPGRICHIHFQVYVSSNYAAISQLTFDVATKQAIYTNNPTLYTNGTDPTTLSNDNVFADGYAYQMAPLTPNATTGGYNSFLEVTIQGSGGPTGNLEKENAKQFALGQNYPNPYRERTTIPLELLRAAAVTVDLYDLQGRKVANLCAQRLGAGRHEIVMDADALGIAAGNYAYQVEIENAEGVFRGCRRMTMQP